MRANTFNRIINTIATLLFTVLMYFTVTSAIQGL